MRNAIEFVDAGIGQMVNELEKQHLLDSTLIIVTAKHGQSPVDTNRFFPIPGKTNNGTSPADVLVGANPHLLPFSESPLNPDGIGPTQDDVSLLWLADSKDTLTREVLCATSTKAGWTVVERVPSGSPKGVKECFAVIAPVLPHAIALLSGAAGEHQG